MSNPPGLEGTAVRTVRVVMVAPPYTLTHFLFLFVCSPVRLPLTYPQSVARTFDRNVIFCRIPANARASFNWLSLDNLAMGLARRRPMGPGWAWMGLGAALRE